MSTSWGRFLLGLIRHRLRPDIARTQLIKTMVERLSLNAQCVEENVMDRFIGLVNSVENIMAAGSVGGMATIRLA
jgi:hypothetical protein